MWWWRGRASHLDLWHHGKKRRGHEWLEKNRRKIVKGWYGVGMWFRGWGGLNLMMKINICNLIRVLEKDEVIFRFYFGSLIFFFNFKWSIFKCSGLFQKLWMLEKQELKIISKGPSQFCLLCSTKHFQRTKVCNAVNRKMFPLQLRWMGNFTLHQVDRFRCVCLRVLYYFERVGFVGVLRVRGINLRLFMKRACQYPHQTKK